MTPPFDETEYRERLARVRDAATQRGLDLLVATDPKTLCYLTGYDGHSHYVPQALLVPITDADPVLVLRAMDVPGGRRGTWLADDDVVGYAEACVYAGPHPFTVVADTVAARGWARGRIGAEFDGTLTPHELDLLRTGLPLASLVAADGIVEWVRTVKTPAELAVLREAAAISDHAMRVAHDVIAPGVREADAAAAVYAALISGPDGLYGSTPAQPYMAAGRRTDTAHPRWDGSTYPTGVPVLVELGGHRHNYAAGLTRTIHLGEPPPDYRRIEAAVTEGRLAAVAAIAPGVPAEEVDAAFRRTVEPHGVFKAARTGYSIGLSFPPAVWLDRTVSLAPGDRTPLAVGMVIHLMLAVWLDGGGYGFSETLIVGADGAELLSTIPRELLVKP